MELIIVYNNFQIREQNCIPIFFKLIIKNFNNNYLQALIDKLLKTNIKTNKLRMVLF